MMKQIACVARHPSVERCKKLRGLPGTLTTSSWLANARRFLGDEGVDGFAEFAGGRGKGKGDGGGADARYAITLWVLDPSVPVDGATR